MPRLVQLAPPFHAGRTIGFEREKTVEIGRSRGCDLVVEDPLVWRREISFRMVEDGRVVALHIGEGTSYLINSERCPRAQVLKHGDRIQLGASAVFRFEEEAPEALSAPGDPSTEEALRRAIKEAEGDEAPYLVYADWLLQRGHPHGLVINMQRAAPSSAQALLERHSDYFFSSGGSAQLYVTMWRLGFWHQLSITPSKTIEEELALIDSLLSHPLAMVVRSMELSLSEGAYSRALELLEKHAPPLRQLRLGPAGGHEREHLEDLCLLAQAAPRLEQLEVLGLRMSIDFPSLGGLHHLCLSSSSVSQAGYLRALVAQRWPKLRALELGPGTYGRENKEALAQARVELMSGLQAPSLESFTFDRVEGGWSQVLDDLARASFAPQLRRLVLNVQETLEPEHAALLERTLEQFEVLERLELGGSWHGAREGNPALRARLTPLVPELYLWGER